MSKIYHLTEQQNAILDTLFFLDENDEEDAEVVASLKKELLRIRGSAEQTLVFLSKILLESRAILEAREEVKRKAERRRKTAEKSVERLTAVIERIMGNFDIQKIQCDECDMSMQMTPGRLEYAPDFDPATLPKDCFKLEFKPLAKEIKAHIEEGVIFEGIELVSKETLRIK